MVIEKNRDIAILRSMGFTPRDISAVFLWQGGIVLSVGILLGCLTGFLATYGISQIPIRIRGIFSTDSFVVNWDINHYFWAIFIASFFLCQLQSWIPARRAARIEPAKNHPRNHLMEIQDDNVIIRVTELNTSFVEGEGRVHALRGVSFDCKAGSDRGRWPIRMWKKHASLLIRFTRPSGSR